MITIDQLLESVDLDFEPRWVTKDMMGHVRVWEKEPTRTREHWTCGGTSKFTAYERLKLSEFDGKDWTECIYEVPRKEVISKMETTEPIKKLNLLHDSALLWGKKINELVDMVNNIISVQEKMIDSRFVVDAVNELKGAKNE